MTEFTDMRSSSQRQYLARTGGNCLPPPWQSLATIELYCRFVVARSSRITNQVFVGSRCQV